MSRQTPAELPQLGPAEIESLVRRLLVVPKTERDQQLDAWCPDPMARREVRALFEDRQSLRTYLDRIETDGSTATLDLEQMAENQAATNAPTVELASDDHRGHFFPATSLQIPQPDSIGPYRVLEELGRGGMGIVFLAEQLEPVRRRLAIKRIQRNLGDPVSAARFEAERQAMARLSHPNIAQIFEAGKTEEGFPYFAMEYVEDGLPITDYCDRHRLTIEERLQLFLSVCRGVQHAHQRGIIHRDLKPSNVLVKQQQGESIAKVIDFGLAKALDQPLSGDSQLTLGYLVGTPEYMSPESFLDDVRKEEFDTRNDVYSLGVILYELLVGCRPFQAKGMNFMALLRQRLEREPPLPSRRLASSEEVSLDDVAAARRLAPSMLRRRLAGELDFVVLKAIANEREARYDSVADLGADLDRHLRQEPVAAHPPSRGYRFRKFVQRHRVAAVSAVLILLALVLGTIGTTVGMLRANREAEVARQALSEAEELAGFLEQLFQSSEPGNPAQDMTARELLDAGAAQVAQGFGSQPEAKARILGTIGAIYTHLALYDQAETLLDESLELRRQSVGLEHPATAQVLASLGNLDFQRDRFGDSKENLEAALGVFEAEGLVAEVAKTEQLLASTLTSLGDYDRAELLFHRSLRNWAKADAEAYPGAVATLSGLSSLMLSHERIEEAVELTERALGLAEQSFGPHDPRLARIQRNLASIYLQQGLLDEVFPLLDRALVISEKAYGTEHPLVAEIHSESATVHELSGEFDRAEERYRRAVAIFEQVSGGDSLDLAVVLNNLGTLFWVQQRYDEAEPLYRRSLEIKQQLFEPGNRSIAHGENNLGLIHWKRGEFEQAETLLRRALVSWEALHGPDHSLVAWPLWGLAGVYRDQQRYGEAEPLYRRALAIRERVLPADDKELRNTRLDYAQLLRATGRDAFAAQLEAQAR